MMRRIIFREFDAQGAFLSFLMLLTLAAGCQPAGGPTAFSATLAEPTLMPTFTVIVPTTKPTIISTIPPVLVASPTVPTASAVTPTPAMTPTLAPNALVAGGRSGLRLRAEPADSGAILRYLDEFTPLIVTGRSADTVWLQVITPEGESGWVMAQFVELRVAADTLPVGGQPATQPTVSLPTSESAPVLPQWNAEVNTGGLRLRIRPGTDSNILANLDSGTPVNIVGKTADGGWLQIMTEDGNSGWVRAEYLDTALDLNNVRVTYGSAAAAPTQAQTIRSAPLPGGISGITASARAIFLRGQALGNQPGVFSKVGDSILGAGWYLGPFANMPTLYDYESLRPAIEYFGGVLGRVSLAAAPGFSTFDVLDPAKADPGSCQPGEVPLTCEYRVMKPAVALIMLGTNDAGGVASADYQANLSRIVQMTLERGIIPVLFTIPPRAGFNERVSEFNGIIAGTARANDIPLVDYWSAVQGLPNSGLSDDGTHPSMPSWEYESAVTLTPENLSQYGFVVLNLMSLQVLDALRLQVLY